MDWITIIIYGAAFVFLGAATGIIAGLVGLGGGVIIVPVLALLLKSMGVPHNVTMHLAAGTSLAIMIFTTSSSVIAYQRLKNIRWDIWRKLLPGIFLGVICGTVVAHFLHSSVLRVIFGIYLLLVTIKLFTGFKPKPGKDQLPVNKFLWPITGFVGLLSGMLGVGAGSTTSPLLLYWGVEMKKTAGISSALSLFPIAVIGTICVIFLGTNTHSVHWSTGYIFWPAFGCIMPFTVIFAPVGAKLASKLKPIILQRCFAVILFGIAVKLLWI